MNVYTTCSACGLLLNLADPAYTTHPNCPEPSDPQRDLADLYRGHLLAGRDAEADALAAIIDQAAPAPRLLDAALLYASWGWPVFPLAPGLKTPLTQHGFQDASTDADDIARWWKDQPRANIGLPTGIAFDVIDIDAPKGIGKRDRSKLTAEQIWALQHGGWRSYTAMQDADAIPDIHGIASTAGGGLHLYVPPSGNGNRAGILPGIDYRGEGGYVAAPPSVDSRGFPYLWRHKPSPILTQRPQEVVA